jgi:hypothetical protein
MYFMNSEGLTRWTLSFPVIGASLEAAWSGNEIPFL